MAKVKTRAMSEAEQWSRWYKHVDAKLAEVEALDRPPSVKAGMANELIRGTLRSMGWGDIARRLEALQQWYD